MSSDPEAKRKNESLTDFYKRQERTRKQLEALKKPKRNLENLLEREFLPLLYEQVSFLINTVHSTKFVDVRTYEDDALWRAEWKRRKGKTTNQKNSFFVKQLDLFQTLVKIMTLQSAIRKLSDASIDPKEPGTLGQQEAIRKSAMRQFYRLMISISNYIEPNSTVNVRGKNVAIRSASILDRTTKNEVFMFVRKNDYRTTTITSVYDFLTRLRKKSKKIFWSPSREIAYSLLYADNLDRTHSIEYSTSQRIQNKNGWIKNDVANATIDKTKFKTLYVRLGEYKEEKEKIKLEKERQKWRSILTTILPKENRKSISCELYDDNDPIEENAFGESLSPRCRKGNEESINDYSSSLSSTRSIGSDSIGSDGRDGEEEEKEEDDSFYVRENVRPTDANGTITMDNLVLFVSNSSNEDRNDNVPQENEKTEYVIVWSASVSNEDVSSSYRTGIETDKNWLTWDDLEETTIV
jgi:hypothetical protein